MCKKKSAVEVRARSQTLRPLDWRYVNIIEYFAKYIQLMCNFGVTSLKMTSL